MKQYVFININCYIVSMLDAVVRNVEESEFLQRLHVFNDRNSVLGQQQHFKLSQILQTLNFFNLVA